MNVFRSGINIFCLNVTEEIIYFVEVSTQILHFLLLFCCCCRDTEGVERTKLDTVIFTCIAEVTEMGFPLTITFKRKHYPQWDSYSG